MKNGGETIKRSYRYGLIGCAAATALCIALGRPWVAVSTASGAILGIGILASFDCMVRWAFVPGAVRPGRALLRLALVKYPLIMLALCWLVSCERFSVLAFCGGIVLAHAAIVASAINDMQAERSQPQENCADHSA